MRLSALLIASALAVLSTTAFASDPCAPAPARAVHIAAFAAQMPAADSAVPNASSNPTHSADELAIQAGCLAWESSHAQQAEFIGTVPLGASTSLPTSVAPGRSLAVLEVPGPSLPFLSSPIGPVPPEKTTAPERSQSFSLGVSLIGPR